MKKLHVYIIRSFLGPFVMTFFIALFILLMQFLWKYIDDLVGKGFGLDIIIQLLFYASSTFVPLALPLAILLSSIMTLGNLGEHYETVAIKASGISLQRFLLPLIVTAIVIVMAAFYFSNNVLPVANLKMSALLFDVRSQKPALNIEEGVFYNGIENYVIKINKKEKDGKTMRDIIIFDHKENMYNNKIIVAEWGKMETTPDENYLIFALYNGCNYEEMQGSATTYKLRPLQRTYFKEEIIRFDLSGFQLERTKEELFKDHYKMLNISQLDNQIDSLESDQNKKRNEFSKEILNRYTYFRQIDTAGNYLDTIFPADSNILVKLDNRYNKAKIIDDAIKAARTTKERIFYSIEETQIREEHIRKHYIELHRKFTLSFACLVLFFIGAPLGAIIRKGGFGLPIVMSVLFFVLFHVISITGEKFVREGVIGSFQGMWMASLIFLPLGIFLTYKATTDSAIFDLSVYTRFFQRLLNKKKYLQNNNSSENSNINQ